MSGKGATSPTADALRAMIEQAVSTVREELRKEIEELRSKVEGNTTNIDGALRGLDGLALKMQDVEGQLEGEDDLVSELAVKVDGLMQKVEGTNRSAAKKRNMTDVDARRVLDGEFKDMDHRTAAEAIGLTYAQVYSCRLEFTFKHVHKTLREIGWKNHWAKK